MARLTRRQRIRVRSNIQKGIILFIAAAIIIGILLGIVFAIRGAVKRRQARMSEAFAMAEAAAATPAPTPVPTPEPTPEPPAVDLTSWELTLVRRDHPLPEGFAPELLEIERGEMFDARAVMHLKKLIEDARAAGFEVYVCSGYRSYDTQYMLYWNHVEDYEKKEGLTREEAEAKTSLAVNYPGASEHQLGLAADILEYQNQDMEPYIGGSGLMLWMEEHCADYGFIIRYPEGKTEITGVEYEPWHLRFVGTCARFIMENDLCLEEFLALYR